MDHRKKPRLELLSESDSEVETSETDSDETNSSSPVSSLARSSSLPSLASLSTSSNLSPNIASLATPNISSSTKVNCNVPQTSSISNIPSSSGGDHPDGEQLRASFRAACEEINRELDIIMHPVKTKQNTLKSIADSQQLEGVPGPSRGGAQNWLPPVNPFTSSVTLRQHLEAASNNVRPRRMRPPPGFHPTPQYNVTNLRTASASSVGGEGEGASAGMVRPPPGFHGIGESGADSSGNTSGCLGVLDTEAIIDDLYRQSLSVVRQSVVLASQQSSINANNLYATNPAELLYSLVPRQQQLEPGQYGSQGPHGNELWQHFTNAAATSGSSINDGIIGGGAGYWEDFLQKEVYDVLTSDQNSDLWRQFEEYQRVHYAPGSLRTGSTIFSSENIGPSKHGPVGHCRPRTPHPGHPIENISIQRNFDPQQHAAHFAQAQDVVTLSDRFKTASISNRPPRSEIPQNRNELLGALLLKRLKERATSANVFLETNTTMNVPAITAATASGNIMTTSNNQVEQQPCSHCIQNNNRAAGGCTVHVLRDVQGHTVCPILRNKPCPICNKAHSVHDCPVRKQWDVDMDKKSTS